MRYRLRTLLLLMTFACIYAAWIGYLRNAAAFHYQESNRIAQELSQNMGMTSEEIETLVANIASRSRTRVDSLEFGGGVDIILGEARVEKHRQAVNHRVLANNYNQAILRPWKVLNANFSP